VPRYFELEVSLRSIKPRIWRRFWLPITATFGELHDAIQAASGRWYDGHLHAFRRTARDRQDICGTPVEDDWSGESVRDSAKVPLDLLFDVDAPPGVKQKCVYVYDFGDDWQVDVTLKSIVETGELWRRKLVAGKRAFPPEDSGGPYSYDEWLDLLATDRSELTAEERERLAWLGDWTPDGWVLADAQATFDQRAKVSRSKR
jgi:hypothetical protein